MSWTRRARPPTRLRADERRSIRGALATAKRSRARVCGSRRTATTSSAVRTLAAAAADYERLGLRFDHARSLLASAGRTERLREVGRRAGSLEQAAVVFEAHRAPPAGPTSALRARPASALAARGRAGELTPTEQRVAELAAEGLANKEIAQTLFVTVHTVEVHLARVREARRALAGTAREPPPPQSVAPKD